jgi:hypothetical protein
MKKIYYFFLLSIFLGGCTVYPSNGYTSYSDYPNQYNQPTSYISTPTVVTIRPYYPMPITGCIWKFSPLFGWSWYRPDYGWYVHGEGWRHDDDNRIENPHPFFHQHGMEEERGRYGKQEREEHDEH